MSTKCKGCGDVIYFHPDMGPPELCHPCRVASGVKYLDKDKKP